jgi:hypothetical protein
MSDTAIAYAAERVAEVLVGLVGFSDEHYSCQEADAFATLIRLTRGNADAEGFLAWHAESDDDGDDPAHRELLKRYDDES